MFHIFRNVYFDIDSAMTSNNIDIIILSPMWRESRETLLRASNVLAVCDSLAEFSETQLSGDRSQFWSFIYKYKGQNSRLVIYMQPELLLEMQVELWKNILPYADNKALYWLHRVYIEDCRFRNYLSPNVEADGAKRGYLSLRSLSMNEFDKLNQSTKKIDFLKNLSKEDLSFEYQLADFLYRPESMLKKCVLDKVKHFTWSNWMAELDILKGDILNGIMDVNRLLPTDSVIDVSDPSQIFSQIIGNPYVCWVADQNLFPNNYGYVEQNYDKKIFKQLYSCFYGMWQVNGEDMSELIDLIYSHQYEKLLYRDIARSFGSVYSGGRFRNKMNQVLVSSIYKYKRESKLDALKVLTLS